MAGLFPVGRHDLVFIGAFDFHLTQVGDIALDRDHSPFLAIDGHLGVVGEDDDEGGGLFEYHFVVEFALDHGDRVDGEVAVDAADVELTLVEAFEGAFQTEGGTAIPTTGEEQQPQEHRYDSKTLFHHLILLTSRSFSAYLARPSSRLVALRRASLASAVLPMR